MAFRAMADRARTAWRVERGGWSVEGGGWPIERGGWSVEGGAWRVVHGAWRGERPPSRPRLRSGGFRRLHPPYDYDAPVLRETSRGSLNFAGPPDGRGCSAKFRGNTFFGETLGAPLESQCSKGDRRQEGFAKGFGVWRNPPVWQNPGVAGHLVGAEISWGSASPLRKQVPVFV